jgi:uncharacterized protein DUF4058
MPSPFPGMDPYIEGQVWKDFHGAFLYEMRTELVRQVRPEYEVLAQEDVYVEYAEDRGRRTIEPDLLIGGTAARTPRSGTDLITPAAPVPVPLPALALEEERHTFLEITRLPGRRLVTVLELLSPTNKQPGDKARDRYLEKRRDIQASSVHLVEIDLLRGGARLPMESPLPPAAYYLLVSRWERRPIADVTPLALRAPLPQMLVPLLDEDAAGVDLQSVFESVYDRAGYDYILDYATPVVPPLEEEDALWAEACVAQWHATRGG